MKTRYPLFLITIAYFLLSIINISFAMFALICMALPFILLYKNGKKSWCHGSCPRADLFSRIKMGKKGSRAPLWLMNDRARKIMLSYFIASLLFIALSTWMVALGRVEAMENLRILIMFKIPWPLPQLIEIPHIPAAIVHLAYRFFSLMTTSTLIGLILTLRFKPKTWCTVCPVNTISNKLVSAIKEQA